MNKKDIFFRLTLLELRALLEHLRLGLTHLKTQLSPEQLKKFLSFGSLEAKQKQNIKGTVAEKTGSFALILNMIFTSVIGTWLGVAGFMELGVGSGHILVTISVLTLIAGIALAYYSFKKTSEKISNAFATQKLYNLQRDVAERLHAKYQKIINVIMHTFDQNCREITDADKQQKKIDIPALKGFSTEAFSQWLVSLDRLLKLSLASRKKHQQYLYNLYNSEVNSFKKWGDKLMTYLDSHHLSVNYLEKNKRQDTDKDFPLNFLTAPQINLVKQEFTPRSWLRENGIDLIKNLIPTLIGGFGSIFVYFDSSKRIGSIFGYNHIAELLSHPIARIIELLLALTISIYFTYSYVRGNYQTYKRDKLLSKTKTDIGNVEKSIIEDMAHLNVLRKVKKRLGQLVYVFNLLDKLAMRETHEPAAAQ